MKRIVTVAVSLWMVSGCIDEVPDLDSAGTEAGMQRAGLSPPCSYPATLEITAVNIGQGNATIIATPSMIVLSDVGESYWNSHRDADAIDLAMTSRYGCRSLDLVVVSHFQVDHVGYVGYGGLWYLVNVLGYTVGETLVRDYEANVGTTSGTYDNWLAYLDTPEARAALSPRTAVAGERIDLGGGIALDITNVDTRTPGCPGGWGSKSDLSCGGEYVWPSEVLGDHRLDPAAPSENDYSIGFVVSVGDFDMYIGGDTNGENLDSGYGSKTHDVETYVGREIGEVDVLLVNHHGSDHSTNSSFVAFLDPHLAVISVGNANTFGHARQAVVDRLLGVVGGVLTRDTWLYMTERGDDGPGGCLKDYEKSVKAAAELYGRATIASDADGDYCTVEGGDVDIVVSTDGSTYTVEGVAYTSAVGDGSPLCDLDGACEPGEDCHTCPADCIASSGALCGNGVCEASNTEDCLSCPADCNGKRNGKSSGRFCCGATEGCSNPKCSADGFSCTSIPASPSCCGDGACDGIEDGLVCELDCGAPPPTSCGDGVCDPGEDCESCSTDCAGKTGGKPSSRFCCGDGIAQEPEGGGSVCDGNF